MVPEDEEAEEVAEADAVADANEVVALDAEEEEADANPEATTEDEEVPGFPNGGRIESTSRNSSVRALSTASFARRCVSLTALRRPPPPSGLREADD